MYLAQLELCFSNTKQPPCNRSHFRLDLYNESNLQYSVLKGENNETK